MSKSLSQVVLPGLAVLALVVAGGIAFVKNENASNQILELEHKLNKAVYDMSKVQDEAALSKEALSKVQGELATLQATLEQSQKAQTQKAEISGNLRQATVVAQGRLGLGRAALGEEVKAWDLDVLPDGRGLPEGKGDVFMGEEVFAEKCASCHGDFAEGVDNWPVLAGGLDTLADKDPVKTVGSYWPHLSTVWDYVHRSMPFGEAQSLSHDEVYATVAYILYSNDLVDEDFELTHENFTSVVLPNAEGFRPDDRGQVEYEMWRQEPCMEACKETVEITMRASILDVTPEADNLMEQGRASAAHVTEATLASDQTSTNPAGALDPVLVEKGQKVFKKCKACHQVGTSAKNRTGPVLNGIIASPMGAVEGFKYSRAFKAANVKGRIWTQEAMAGFLKKPKSYIKGTKMSFSGLKSDEDIAGVIEFLKMHGAN